MRARCNNPKNDCYKHYGGRGISVCNEWDDYLSFKDWALRNEYSEELTLDRINVNGNYEPGNCRWVSQKAQMRNTRINHYITYNGQTKTLVEWSELSGIPYHTLKQRINKSMWPVEKALTTPVKICGKNGA